MAKNGNHGVVISESDSITVGPITGATGVAIGNGAHVAVNGEDFRADEEDQ